MNFKFYLLRFIAGLGFSLSLYAEISPVDCDILKATEGNCNPYHQMLIYSKDIQDVKPIVKPLFPKGIKSTKQLDVQKPQKFHKIIEHTSIIDNKLVEEPMDTPLKKNNNTLIEEDNQYDKIGFYRINAGDILGKIVNKFNISMIKTLKLNHLNKSDTLKIGQKIKIPLSQKMIDTIDSASYKIEKGDTLLSIAQRFNVDTKLLIKVNKLHSTVIQEGKTLILPLPHKMKMLKKIELQRIAQKKAEELRLEKQRRLTEKRKKQYVRRKSIGRHRLRVTATAYTSHRAQTDSTPFLAAWNNRLRPGMKIIAVSRDLLSRYGLRNGTRVRISGLRGYYRVRDKMNKRFRKRIDIYMGTNRRRALRWGRRSVNIYW